MDLYTSSLREFILIKIFFRSYIISVISFIDFISDSEPSSHPDGIVITYDSVLRQEKRNPRSFPIPNG